MSKADFYSRDLEKAFSLIKENPQLAVDKLGKYLEEYPKHYSAYTYYISALISNNQIDEAQEMINYIKELDKDENFNNKKNLVDRLEANIIYTQIRILLKKKKYDECLDYCEGEYQFLKKYNRGVDAAIVYCRQKLGLDSSDIVDNDGYFISQLICYDEESFLKHILKYQLDSGLETDCFFLSDFSLTKAISEVKRIIPSDEHAFSDGLVTNKYYFKYDGCGRRDNKITDYFMVVNICDTKKLISIHPCFEGEHFNYIDLNYLREQEKTPVKKKSRIDIFNEKYGIK